CRPPSTTSSHLPLSRPPPTPTPFPYTTLFRSTALAEEVRQNEQDVNQLEMTIDEECTQVLARRQPAARDLRLVFSVAKIVNDLEDRKSTRLNSSHVKISYAAFCLKKKTPSCTL